MSAIAALFAVLIVWAIYILPMLVAMQRLHRSRATIAILNIFLGWTLLGWVICLAWACGPEVDRQPDPALIRRGDV